MEIVLTEKSFPTNRGGKLRIFPGSTSTRIEVVKADPEGPVCLSVCVDNDELRMALNSIPAREKI